MAEEACAQSESANHVKQTNEEIVDELLKELGGVNVKPNIHDDASEMKDAPHFDEVPPEGSPVKDGGHSSCEASEAEKKDDVIDDLIDEVGLKDIEEGLSEEEKQQRRSEAELSKSQGNDNFKGGHYKESVANYTLGLRTCPLAFPKDRAVLYANRAAAKMKLDLKPSAIEDCSKAIELDPSYLKARLRRANLNEETDKLDEALADFQEVLKIDPLHRDALYATKRLPERINERNEKMKTEMFAKLKDLGNMILRPFNLSTDNFQVNQDPGTGSYSVNFKSGPSS